MRDALAFRLARVLPRALMWLPFSVAAAGLAGAAIAALPAHPLAGLLGAGFELWGIAAGHAADGAASIFAVSFVEE